MESERSDSSTVESSSVHSEESNIHNDKSSDNNQTSSFEIKEKAKNSFPEALSQGRKEQINQSY
ncbi:hypothetical protein [Enterococcus sp. DIV0691]|uniref:hypothetical protein n=1 Tax=Enterococcus sp. DIV0691 TaxID=2774703 RepID=UPI003F68626D